ncbi:MAG: hypothetical protein SFU86_02445 [Pirellulaceae bacterium]|nr:hypothetical protein [Pirellulaceae bacterium]
MSRQRIRRLGIEGLEARNLLAGLVQVEATGGNLLVRGDNVANQVVIVQLAAGQFAVVGLGGTEVAGGTNLNGNSVRTFTGIAANIDVDLRGGDDILGIGNDAAALVDLADYFGYEGDLGDTDQLEDDLHALLGAAAGATLDARNLILRLGEGDDGVGIVDVNIRQRIDANLGSGRNAFGVDSSTIGDDLILRGGSGIDDMLLFENDIAQMLDVHLGEGNNFAIVEGCSIGESAVLSTGRGADFIGLTNTNVAVHLVIQSGAGNDSVFTNNQGSGGVFVGQNEEIDTGAGSDFVGVEALVGRVLKINTGGGSDGVSVQNSAVGDDLLIDTGAEQDNSALSVGYFADFGDQRGAGGVVLGGVNVIDNLVVKLGSGNDTLAVDTVDVGHDAHLDAGSGNDGVDIDDLDVQNLLFALLGSGNDQLAIRNSSAKKALLDGGAGSDTLVAGGGNVFGKRRVTGF